MSTLIAKIEPLLEALVPKEIISNCCQYIDPKMFDDIVVERALEYCGNFTCSNLPNRYKTYYCSKTCFVASQYLKSQLSREPLAFRKPNLKFHFYEQSLIQEIVDPGNDELSAKRGPHLHDQPPTEHLHNEPPTEHLHNELSTEHLHNEPPTEHLHNEPPTEHLHNEPPTEHLHNDAMTNNELNHIDHIEKSGFDTDSTLVNDKKIVDTDASWLLSSKSALPELSLFGSTFVCLGKLATSQTTLFIAQKKFTPSGQSVKKTVFVNRMLKL